MGTIYNIAKEYATTGTTTDPYLHTFPNNVMITSIYNVLLVIFNKIGAKDFLTVATVFNSLLVAVSGILLYYNTKKMFDEDKALMVLFITVMTTPLYLYSASYYSDTFSMFLTMILLNLYLRIEEKDNLKSTIIWQVLFAISMVIGIKMKITCTFIIIAICVYKILNLQINIKNIIKKFGISIILTGMLFILYNVFINPIYITNEEYTEAYKIPTEHWIMMGLNGRGNFSYEEYHYTQSFPTYKERQDATRKEIIERITRMYQENTLFKHIIGKLGFAWYDGSYYAPDVLRREPVKKRYLHEFVLEAGSKTAIYKYWPQCMHFGMLIFMCFNVYRVLKERNYLAKDNILFITIYGLLVFLLIWENRSRYLITNLPIIMMSQLGGIEYIANRKE